MRKSYLDASRGPVFYQIPLASSSLQRLVPTSPSCQSKCTRPFAVEHYPSRPILRPGNRHGKRCEVPAAPLFDMNLPFLFIVQTAPSISSFEKCLGLVKASYAFQPPCLKYLGLDSRSILPGFPHSHCCCHGQGMKTLARSMQNNDGCGRCLLVSLPSYRVWGMKWGPGEGLWHSRPLTSPVTVSLTSMSIISAWESGQRPNIPISQSLVPNIHLPKILFLQDRYEYLRERR